MRWQLRSILNRLQAWWPTDILGLLLLIIGLAGELNGPIPYPPIPGLEKVHRDLSNELIGIGITVLIIDNANKSLATREEKKRLILQMGSPDHGFAIEAARQLGQRGWLYDNSLVGADLRGADLSWATLRGANLHGADLSEANLSEASLSEANLHRAYLIGADLEEADLRGATLHGADLSRATLRWADLSWATLSEANLHGADLSWANLHGADLSWANLIEANLEGAYLHEADLEGATVTEEQLATTRSLDGAILPDGSKREEVNK